MLDGFHKNSGKGKAFGYRKGMRVMVKKRAVFFKNPMRKLLAFGNIRDYGNFAAYGKSFIIAPRSEQAAHHSPHNIVAKRRPLFPIGVKGYALFNGSVGIKLLPPNIFVIIPAV